MPPGQPVHRCAGECGLLRPCKRHRGRWYCRECNPALSAARAENGSHAPDSAARTVATDGGSDQ